MSCRRQRCESVGELLQVSEAVGHKLFVTENRLLITWTTMLNQPRVDMTTACDVLCVKRWLRQKH